MADLDLLRIAARLREEKAKLLDANLRSREQERQTSTQNYADEADFAASSLVQGVNVRLRDRERMLMNKIEQALAKIETGNFGVCEGCEEPIEARRLEARPVAELCIRCKEAEEQAERIFGSA